MKNDIFDFGDDVGYKLISKQLDTGENRFLYVLGGSVSGPITELGPRFKDCVSAIDKHGDVFEVFGGVYQRHEGKCFDVLLKICLGAINKYYKDLQESGKIVFNVLPVVKFLAIYYRGIDDMLSTWLFILAYRTNPELFEWSLSDVRAEAYSPHMKEGHVPSDKTYLDDIVEFTGHEGPGCTAHALFAVISCLNSNNQNYKLFLIKNVESNLYLSRTNFNFEKPDSIKFVSINEAEAFLKIDCATEVIDLINLTNSEDLEIVFCCNSITTEIIRNNVADSQYITDDAESCLELLISKDSFDDLYGLITKLGFDSLIKSDIDIYISGLIRHT